MSETYGHGEGMFVIESASPEVTSRIKIGKTVFLQRNQEPGLGRIIDLFSGFRHIGFIEQDFENSGLCDVYRVPDDNPRGEPIPLTAENVSLDEATRILRQSATQ